MTPVELVRAARELLDAPAAETAGWWSRAAVLLTRQALEQCLASLVEAKGGNPRRASFKAQLLVLPQLVADDDLSARVAWVWEALSQASHHHGYELPPTAVEVGRWLDVVEDLVSTVQRR